MATIDRMEGTVIISMSEPAAQFLAACIAVAGDEFAVEHGLGDEYSVAAVEEVRELGTELMRSEIVSS